MGSYHPSPFLDQWKGFLKLLSSHNFQGSDVDTMVLPLVPMFHTGAFDLPFRILKEKEVIQLSGLQGLWNNVSLSDVELVPNRQVMNQTEAYAVFSELCEQIEKEAKKRKCKKFQLDTTLPSYEVLHIQVQLHQCRTPNRLRTMSLVSLVSLT